MHKEITFLFEGQKYDRNVLEEYIPKQLMSKAISKGKLAYIGYCLHGNIQTFILPKVFVNKEGYAFGQNANKPLSSSIVTDKTMADTLDVLPNWMGRALKYYRQRQMKSDIVKDIDQEILRSNGEEDESTLYEKIYSLEDYYLMNKDLFLFIYEQAHSGYNKINWNKTIHTKQPYINGSSVVYFDVITRKKRVDYDEELMVLFFNTLDYINDKYKFNIAEESYYNLIPTEEFKDLVATSSILSKLSEIKGNYFSDKMRELWELLYAFHSSEDDFNHDNKTEYMLVNKFESVFEDMIDSLISDEKDTLFTKKHQSDDKRIDHLFLGKSVFDDTTDIYFIGDSKYYSEDQETTDVSVAKQFTYATNVIQDAMDKRNDEEWAKVYRDEHTRGYNVTPNFLIRGKEYSTYEEHKLEAYEMENDNFFSERNHIKECLFDRNTLFLLQYSINFLFVLKNYNDNNAFARDDIKQKLEESVSEDLKRRLSAKYLLAKFIVHDEALLDSIVKKNFWTLEGKIMRFTPKNGSKPFFILAVQSLDKDGNSNSKELDSLRNHFTLFPNYFEEVPDYKLYIKKETTDA